MEQHLRAPQAHFHLRYGNQSLCPFAKGRCPAPGNLVLKDIREYSKRRMSHCGKLSVLSGSKLAGRSHKYAQLARSECKHLAPPNQVVAHQKHEGFCYI